MKLRAHVTKFGGRLLQSRDHLLGIAALMLVCAMLAALCTWATPADQLLERVCALFSPMAIEWRR